MLRGYRKVYLLLTTLMLTVFYLPAWEATALTIDFNELYNGQSPGIFSINMLTYQNNNGPLTYDLDDEVLTMTFIKLPYTTPYAKIDLNYDPFIYNNGGGSLKVQFNQNVDLDSVDFMGLYGSPADRVTVTAYEQGQSLGNATIDFNSGWTHGLFDDLIFGHVDALIFTAGRGSNPNFGYMAIDNITLNAVTAVPEPATLLLLATGLMGFVRIRLRK